MEKSMKWTIIGLCATVFCLAVALVCAILRKFDTVSTVMFAVIAAFSVAIIVLLVLDILAERKKAKAEPKTEEAKTDAE